MWQVDTVEPLDMVLCTQAVIPFKICEINSFYYIFDFHLT